MKEAIKLGNFELGFVDMGSLWLDGGAMFGVVPKVLWSKVFPSDEKNRIPLACNSLYIKHPQGVVLVETGVGNRWKPKEREIYGIRSVDMAQSLKKVGLTLEEVTYVINTHLHFDHAGGNCIERYNNLVPTFPRAHYVIQRDEWEHALTPYPKDKASYRREDFFPLATQGRLHITDGNEEILPGVWVWKVESHSPGMQVVYIESKGQKAIFWGDLIPTTRHVKLPWVMSYDCFPVETIQWKEKLLSQAVKEGFLALFYHDPDYKAGKILEKPTGSFTFTPL